MTRNHLLAAAIAAVLGACSSFAVWVFVTRSKLPTVAVTFVSDPPGATLVSADSRIMLGVTPVTASYSAPKDWRACATFDGFRARWADGRQAVVNNIELCPDAGDDQVVRFSAAPSGRRPSRRPAPVSRQSKDAEVRPASELPRENSREMRPSATDAQPVAVPETPPVAVASAPSVPTLTGIPEPTASRNSDRRSRVSSLPVLVVGRQSSETGYSFVVPGYVSTQSNGHVNCFGTSSGTVNGSMRANRIGGFVYGSYDGTYSGTTSTDCSGTSTSTTTVAPPREVSYSVTGATLSLRLQDGRIAVVNSNSKPDWWSLGQVRRSCRVPMTDRFDAEFDGEKVKLLWRVGISGEKGQSETYRLLEIVEPAQQ